MPHVLRGKNWGLVFYVPCGSHLEVQEVISKDFSSPQTLSRRAESFPLVLTSTGAQELWERVLEACAEDPGPQSASSGLGVQALSVIAL